ncbi:unnamed protein product [Cylindrotheca closterium]|uniref:CHAT domain-containing protein n=1 Tax=Cylindrotheca closterium TaxID=2856 RepID=A0AAD2FW45_9STRA|nr:unnamed protein product [Cylindrotheca closterium]
MATGQAIAPDNMERRMSHESLVQAKQEMAQNSNGVRIKSGHMLYGEELEEFCSQRGLCPLCGRVKIKRKAFKLFKKSKWENLTVKSRTTGKYKVYKGYCLSEGCFSLDQVRRITSTNGTQHAQRPRYPKRWSSADDSYPLGDDDTVFSLTPPQEHRFPTEELKEELRQNPKHVDDRIPLSIVQATIRELSSNESITILDLSKVAIRTSDMRMLVSFFEENTFLRTLMLENCLLDDEQAVLLGGGLEAASDMTLTKLYLTENKIGDSGLESICNYLETSSTLEKFDISKNECSSMGAVKIFKAFSQNPLTKIVALNLSHNKIYDLDEDQFGIKTFLTRNRTLRVLNLEGNVIHAEGVKSIAKGIISNTNSTLERLYLGFNSIGDDGAIILANVLERNTTLTYLGLIENAIGNPGAKALLLALDTNKYISEISGLWRNNIDRRFIVVAIRRLLLASDRIAKRRRQPDNPMEPVRSAPPPRVSIARPAPKQPQPEQPQFPPEDESAVSGDVGFGTLSYAPSIASSVPSQITPDGFPMSPLRNDRNGITSMNGTRSPKKSPKRDPNLPVDRLTIFQSAPLAYFDKIAGAHRGIPLIDYRDEEMVVAQSVSFSVDSTIEVSIKTATPANLSSFLQEKDNRVLHFSCHGHPDYIPLENGFGSLHILPHEGLAKLVAVNGSNLHTVFVSSCHAHSIGQAFVKAGVKHVVCCEREDNFQDPVASEFVQTFYQALARDLTLFQAFESAKKAVAASMHATNKRNLSKRFRLLPEMDEVENFHKVPVFFAGMPPQSPLGFWKKQPQLPKLPKHFVGREVDIYDVLQALRAEDMVRINGPPGHGKESVVAALADYAILRSEAFGVDGVFWLPPMPGVVPVKDSLYGDLCQCVSTLQDAPEDIWDKNERLMECRDRIDIEMENMKPLLVVDDSLISFVSAGAQTGFESFLSHLMNTSAAKVIKVMSGGETPSALSGNSMISSSSKIEEASFEISPLDFRSTAKLYGGISNFISSSGCPAAHTATEFAELAEPPFITRVSMPSSVVSQRRSDLYARMGSGIPAATVAIAQGQSKKAFIELIKIANIPEVHVGTLGALEKTLEKMTRLQTAAIKERNYLRALDLDRIIEEIEEMRPEFPTLEELKMEEEVLKADLAEAIGNKNYDEAANIKKEMLLLKKKISRERTNNNGDSAGEATDRMDEVQLQIKNMIEDVRLEDLDEAVTFVIEGADGTKCNFVIEVGEVYDFQPTYTANGVVVWANESCALGGNPMHDKLLEKGGPALVNDIESLPIVTKTGHGPVRCGTGNAVIVGPEKYGELGTPCLILAVGPLSPHNSEDAVDDDTDILHHIKMMLRSSYRSTLILARHAGLQALALNILTTRKTGKAYHETVQMGLQTLVEEAQFCTVKQYQVMASSPNEAALLAGLMTEMGYQRLSAKTYEL